MKKNPKLLAAVLSAFSVIAVGACFAQEAPKQALREVPFTDVKLSDDFWAPRIETNRLVSVPHNIKWCETETERINNFKVAGGLKDGHFGGIVYDDSDVYKIVEGFAYTLAAHPDPELKKKADEWIDYFRRAQQDDGYLMTYFIIDHPTEKWTNLAGMHELYTAGHMAEAAVAYKRSTGDDTFLKVNLALLDLICKRYGPNEGQLKNVPGHEELELALVKAYQLTGDRKYLDEAKFFIDIRGVAEGRETKLFGEYAQDHIPVREQTEIVGHAVRAMYLYSGATDVAGYFKDDELYAAMRRIYLNLTRNKMYITGGIGSSGSNEGFEGNFVLPNTTAYCETCAAIGMLFWTHRLNLATGKAEYVDVMERAAYNGFMSGYSLNGDGYFYVNPLASNGSAHREPFFSCACCPSNVTRALPSIPGYIYATAESTAAVNGADTVVVNMYAAGKSTIELADKYVDIEQKTRYPFDGAVEITASVRMKDENAAPTPFVLKTRVPEWSGLPADADGYAAQTIIPSKDKPSVATLNFPFEVKRMIANPNVEADAGRVALQRGPVVYCFEQVDNPDVRVDRILLAKDPEFRVETRENYIQDENTNDATRGAASRTVDVILCKDFKGRTLTAVPYCVWDNRAAGKMAVWVEQVGLETGENAPVAALNWTDGESPILYQPLPAEILTDAIPENSDPEFELVMSDECDPYTTFNGLNQSANPASSADLEVPRATWWPNKGTKEWLEYDFRDAKTLSSAAVYWYDDRSLNGGCAVPSEWKLLWFDESANEWVDVETTDAYGVELDRDNVVNFKEITTRRIRLEAQMQPELAGGVLRWEVK